MLVAAAAEKTPSFAGVIATAAYTGARIREVLAIRWCDIDFERKLIHLCGQVNVDGTAIVDMKTAESVRFGPFVFHIARAELRRGDEIIHLTDRERTMLTVLTARPGETVPRLALAPNVAVANERAVGGTF